MVITSPFNIRKQTISNATIKCDPGGNDNDHIACCDVVDCELLLIDLRTMLNECTFRNCRVIAEQEVTGGWTNCRWNNCTFVGDFSQAVYGSRNVDCSLPDGSMVLGCDFTKANLNDVGLINADLKSIRFPMWPNVTLLEPFPRKSELRSLTLPKGFGEWWFYFSSGIHPTHSSLTFNWEMVRRTVGRWEDPPDIEPEKGEVRSILAHLPYVLM